MKIDEPLDIWYADILELPSESKNAEYEKRVFT